MSAATEQVFPTWMCTPQQFVAGQAWLPTDQGRLLGAFLSPKSMLKSGKAGNYEVNIFELSSWKHVPNLFWVTIITSLYLYTHNVHIYIYTNTCTHTQIYIYIYIHSLHYPFWKPRRPSWKNGNLRGRSALPSATRLGAPGVHIGQGPGERLNARGPCWRRRREMGNDGKNEE